MRCEKVDRESKGAHSHSFSFSPVSCILFCVRNLGRYKRGRQLREGVRKKRSDKLFELTAIIIIISRVYLVYLYHTVVPCCCRHYY